MKLKLVLFGLLGISNLCSQNVHNAILVWSDTQNPVGTTYNVKRAQGLCTGTPTFNTVATGLNVKTYTDNTVQTGNYCFVVTATFNGVESSNSNTVLASVPSFPPSTLTVTVN